MHCHVDRLSPNPTQYSPTLNSRKSNTLASKFIDYATVILWLITLVTVVGLVIFFITMMYRSTRMIQDKPQEWLKRDGHEKKESKQEFLLRMKEWSETVRTGDLFVTGYRLPKSFVTRHFFRSRWGHSAIAWRNPETKELFLYEAAVYCFDKKYWHTFAIPFDQWVVYNRRCSIGRVPLLFRQDSEEEDPFTDARRLTLSKALKRAFELHHNSGMTLDHFDTGWRRFIVDKPFVPLKYPEPLPEDVLAKKDKIMTLRSGGNKNFRYTCFEMCNRIYMEAGVMQKIKHESYWKPGTFMNEDVPLTSEYQWGKSEWWN